MMRSRPASLCLALALLGACAAGSPEDNQTQDSATTSVLPALTPEALQSVVHDEPSRRFYGARDWKPVWNELRTRTLLGVIAQADRHGLAPERFLDPSRLPHDAARREAMLTRAALRLAETLANGQVDPAQFRSIYTLPRARTDVVAGFTRAIATALGRWFAGLAPDDAQYRALSSAYLRYRDLAATEQRSKIPQGKTLRTGDEDPRVPAIRAVVERLGYLPGRGSEQPDLLYSADLAAAITALQYDSGLRHDGVTGPATLAVLNRSAAERARQLAVNLERLRWLERQPPSTRIDVNTGAAELIYWRDGNVADRRRVAVGRSGWATPQLGTPIFRLVANPSWTVPASIARSELAHKSAAYLTAHNMTRRGKWIVQRPGPNNALGQVKFDMRDRYAIYLHDTPARAIFSRNERHLSHGCVRVEDALGFARLLADQDGKRDAFEAALASGRKHYITLDRPIPVRLIYLTAYLDANGNVRFRPDVYGWDDAVGKAMHLGHGRRAKTMSPAPDIAP